MSFVVSFSLDLILFCHRCRSKSCYFMYHLLDHLTFISSDGLHTWYISSNNNWATVRFPLLGKKCIYKAITYCLKFRSGTHILQNCERLWGLLILQLVLNLSISFVWHLPFFNTCMTSVDQNYSWCLHFEHHLKILTTLQSEEVKFFLHHSVKPSGNSEWNALALQPVGGLLVLLPCIYVP
jgi:hypothetical protein